jgi:alpha-1,3-rhamnosyltransferase
MATEEPLVTVIIPSYNHARYLANAMQSVLDQTYSNIELIVVDDGSTDESTDVARRFEHHENVIVIANSQNKGQGAVINQAFGIARGNFISFLPSDDWYLPEKTALQVAKFMAAPPEVGVVYGMGARYFEDSGETKLVELPRHRGWIVKQLIREGNFVYPATPMFRRECFDKVSFDESYKAEGEAIYLKIGLYYRFDYVDDVVAVMRDHVENTGKRVAMMHDDNLRYWNEFFELQALPEEIMELRPLPLSRIHRLKGVELVMTNKAFDTGRTALLEALRLRPLLLLDYRLMLSLLITFLPDTLAMHVVERLNRIRTRTSGC